MVTQQVEVEIAEVGGLLQDGVSLVLIAAAGDDGGQVVAGVIGSVSEIAADHHGGVIEKGAVSFGNLVEVEEKLVQMLENVDLDAAEVGELVSLATVVGKGVPAAGGCTWPERGELMTYCSAPRAED